MFNYRTNVLFVPGFIIAWLIIFISSTTLSAAGPAYTMKQRFGFGFDQHNCVGDCIPKTRNVDEFDYKSLGAGWYFDWGNGSGKTGGPREGLEWMGLVGGWATKTDAEITSSCNSLKTQINNNKSKYPNGMMWTVGNEIGWDDTRSPQTYAREFNAWKNCLKSINNTFKVGSGAILQPTLRLPFNNKDIVCVNSSYPETNGYMSGKNYFISYINTLKTQYNNNLPDFIVNHGYTPCNNTSYSNSNWISFSLFQASILEQRRTMKDLGLQDRDLIIKEFAPLPHTDNAAIQNYMMQTVKYMADTKDQNLGNPNDEYRLVQRFAWFEFNSWKGKSAQDNTSYPALELFDTNTLAIKPLGTKYKTIIAQYVLTLATPSPTIVPTYQATPTITPRPTVRPTSISTLIPTPIPTPTSTPTVTQGNLNGDSKINTLDLVFLLQHWGQNSLYSIETLTNILKNWRS